MRFFLFLLCLQPALLLASPRVVTSIAPLHEIAGALMSGVDSPQLIIDNHQSAHHFAFKPSHMRRLQQADLVIWVDRHFEAGFGRLHEILPPSTRALELMPALGIDSNDGHFWYSPVLLRQSIDLVAQALVSIDPANDRVYRANAQRLDQAVASWDLRIQRQWSNNPLRLITDHDFLTHFGRRFENFQLTSVHDHHDSHGGLKRLGDIENWLRDAPANCLLTLDTTPTALVSSLVAKYRLPIVKLSTTTITNPGPSAILRRLQKLEVALETCLHAS